MAGGVEAAGFDFSVEEEKGRQQARRVEGVLAEGLMDLDRATYHSCLRPVCADDVPIVGRTHIGNLYVSTGHGSKGWTYSWGSAGNGIVVI